MAHGPVEVSDTCMSVHISVRMPAHMAAYVFVRMPAHSEVDGAWTLQGPGNRSLAPTSARAQHSTAWHGTARHGTAQRSTARTHSHARARFSPVDGHRAQLADSALRKKLHVRICRFRVSCILASVASIASVASVASVASRCVASHHASHGSAQHDASRRYVITPVSHACRRRPA